MPGGLALPGCRSFTGQLRLRPGRHAVLFLIEGLPMPIEHLKRLQKHFDLCILRAPEHEESERFRRWRNCVGHLIDFPGMSLSAAWAASDPARYKAHTAPL
jgi:hypothetical protein